MTMSEPTPSPTPDHGWHTLTLPREVRAVLEAAPSVTMASTVDQLADLAVKDAVGGFHDVAYDVPGRGEVVEARVCRVKNGIAANYVETYMRRRDPDCMLIADDSPTDKVRYHERFGESFDRVRQETFDWLKTQPLAMFAFTAGVGEKGIDALAIAPANAGFFAMGLALLQGIRPVETLDASFSPRAVIYVAPPFRHTHFDGQQIVVHNRAEDLHELFSYNLYPGPSAKKGIYGVLLTMGEMEGWTTTHCAIVEVRTPYDNLVAIMHEGASGGGKSEMLEQVHREPDGRLMVGENVVTGKRMYAHLARACSLSPVADDMALCPPHIQGRTRFKKLIALDAEDGWFIRVNHITHYGTDPHLERLTAQPSSPLLFLNIDAQPGSRALIFDHIEDEPGVPCPNPRVIVPRRAVPNVVDGHVRIDIRSFGVRTPPCTREKPSYGIIGLLHVLPPALAWLWRLAAPRGHANLLFDQIMRTTDTIFVLMPNQYVGAWKVGFMPEWLGREYLARRGTGRFRSRQLEPARCPLLGYALEQFHFEGELLDEGLLRVERRRLRQADRERRATAAPYQARGTVRDRLEGRPGGRPPAQDRTSRSRPARSSASRLRSTRNQRDKKLADIRITALLDRGAAFTEDPEGVGCTEDAIKQSPGVVDGFVGDERGIRVETQNGALGPSYPATPRTHLRRSSSAASS